MSKLKIWWIPNLHTLGKDKKQGKRPGAFEREVSSIEEAILLLNFIADYDLYLGDDLISSNAGGLMEFVDGEWLEYTSLEGYTIDEIMDGLPEAEEYDLKQEFFYK